MVPDSTLIHFIEEECSGIRSAFFALIITSLLASHWFLVSWWTKAALVAVVVPTGHPEECLSHCGIDATGQL